MALAVRSSRRGATGRRWLVIGIVVTLFVLLVDASLRASSPNTARTLAAQAWMSRVLPLISATNDQGQQLIQFRSQAIQTSTGAAASSLTSRIQAVASAAKKTYHQAAALHPPSSVQAAAGLLDACLLVRSESSQALAAAVGQALSEVAPAASGNDPAVAAVTTAAQDMEVSDRAYQLFTHNLPRLGVTFPPSQWVPDASQYDPTTLTVWLAALRHSTSLTPIHQLAIQAITTNPAPVSMANGIEILPAQRAMSVTVVVADPGNQPENNLTVSAQVSPALQGGSVRQFINLVPGGAQSVQLGSLYPLEGPLVTLTVTAAPPAGSSTPAASRHVTIQMPSPSSTPTTSTTTPTPITAPAGG